MRSADFTEGLCDGDACRRAVLDGDQCRKALGGRRLCRTCYGRLAEGIGELPRLHAACGVVLGSGVAGGVREKITGGPLPGLVLNGAAAEARTRIVTVLACWSGLVPEARRSPAPIRRVVPLADFLLANLSWLASHSTVPDLSAEVARTIKIARRAAYPDSVRRVVIGRCVMPGCDGVLSATVRPSRAGAGTRVRCGIGRAGRTYYAENDVHGSFSRRKVRAPRQKPAGLENSLGMS